MGIIDEINKAQTIKYDPKAPFDLGSAMLEMIASESRRPFQRKSMTDTLIELANQLCKTEEDRNEFRKAYMKFVENFCKVSGLTD